ncbi:MAG: 2Fe-2S iron-sulfur cluster-binding protein [Planctomycetota bacterium]|jgi:NADPH-dependent glutamate synthase beta subunit-like oxidoreductase
MPRLVIDNREIEVPPGSTVLAAARKLGLNIPVLCFADGYPPSTSCMVCLVKLKDENRMVPSCAALAEDGMQIESETEEVHRIRKGALELLLSDHLGDCIAPCHVACPAHMDIPLMMEQIAAGELQEAIVTVKKDIALPAVLGRVCPDLCERACRRGKVDSAVAICLLKRYVADADLASDQPYLPACKPGSGKKVAIVGAGPTGLSAGYHLLQEGHACTLFDGRDQPGGMLRYEIDENALPRSVLDAEISIIEKMGASFRMNTRIGPDESLADLRKDFDAVLVTIGTVGRDDVDNLGLQATGQGIQIDIKTHETDLPGVFAAGDAVRHSSLVIRSVADGKAAAFCINQFLSGVPIAGIHRPFNIHMGRLSDEELEKFMIGRSRQERVTIEDGSAGGLTDEQARAEALRCLHCECAKQGDCKLQQYADMYGARTRRYGGERKTFERHLQHAEVIYEPGKCILCGLCVQITAKAGEPLGLTFVNRGFKVRVDVPFNESLAEALKLTARECVKNCPTGALVLRKETCDNADLCQSCSNASARDEDD